MRENVRVDQKYGITLTRNESTPDLTQVIDKEGRGNFVATIEIGTNQNAIISRAFNILHAV